VQRLIFHQYHRDFGSIIEKVERRFAALEDLKKGIKPAYEDSDDLLSEVFRVCELIGREGKYYLLCLSVRSRDNPRELIQVELYFDVREPSLIDLGSLFNLLNKQAEEARVLIEGYRDFWVDLPDLPGLLKTTKVNFDDLISKLPLVGKWWFSSVHHAVHSHTEKGRGAIEKDLQDDSEKKSKTSKWIDLYSAGKRDEAEAFLVEEIAKTPERSKRAMLYNDLGYIRSGATEKLKLASKDLETAFDLHSAYLQLTLSNLGVLDLKNENYRKAIERIEAALFLSLTPRELGASYLRLCVPKYKFGFTNSWEQHPANVIEASYVNLGYALLKLRRDQEARDTFKEGLELMPSSVYLRHALARFYLYKKDAQSAYSIYEELAKPPSRVDEAMRREVDYFVNVGRRSKGKSKKKKGRR
jgi:tetratricopeptide (TPR) repeat protein